MLRRWLELNDAIFRFCRQEGGEIVTPKNLRKRVRAKYVASIKRPASIASPDQRGDADDPQGRRQTGWEKTLYYNTR